MPSFSASIQRTQLDNNTLHFTLRGTDEYGLDKSIVNSLRRTLMSEIPAVAFRVAEDSQKDITIELNNTSLHNEFILHRLSMIPLFIDPETYENQYLFYLNVKHDSNEPFLFVTTDDIQIFPLKPGIQEPSTPPQLSEYDMSKPLSKELHEEIFRPFEFRGKRYPILLTELKSTHVEGKYQELICYGSPSVSDGRENACWKAVSDATYTFTKNEELFMRTAQAKAGQKKIIDDDKRKEFIESLRLSESERYFYRDIYNEPNQYDMVITSVHAKTSRELFIQATELMMDKLSSVKSQMIQLIKQESTSISILPHKHANTYIIQLNGQNDTLGNVLQSHIVNKHCQSDSLLSVCGYKKSHPLEEHVSLYVSINPNHEAMSKSEEMKINSLVHFMDEVIEDLLKIYRNIAEEARKQL